MIATKKNKMNKKQLSFSFLWILTAVILLTCIASYRYVHDYYHADKTARRCISDPEDGVTVKKGLHGEYIFQSSHNDSETGFIFYPGGKVEQEAYAPLMSMLANEGITCILVRMPCNLAILNVNAADTLLNGYSGIRNWYIGGHSLGGVAAAMYLKNHAARYKGLILLGAYSSTDLSDLDLSVLSIYGDYDAVLNKDKYQKNKKNLPEDFTEYIISGGCHAFFGSYGSQKGDGIPTISSTEQQRITEQTIITYINTHNN